MCQGVLGISVLYKIEENNKLYIFLTHPAHISVILSVYTPEVRKGFKVMWSVSDGHDLLSAMQTTT